MKPRALHLHNILRSKKGGAHGKTNKAIRKREKQKLRTMNLD